MLKFSSCAARPERDGLAAAPASPARRDTNLLVRTRPLLFAIPNKAGTVL